MSSVTPNIGIFLPFPGQTDFSSSFNVGMVNIDQHDHSGGPNKGVQISTSAIAPLSITYDKLNANVVDTTTGLAVSITAPNQLQTAGILKSIYQNTDGNGLIAKVGNGISGVASAVTIVGKANQIKVVSGDGSSGNPTISFEDTVVNATQPAFNAISSSQSSVTGDGTIYTVQFTNVNVNQATAFDGTSTFTAPVTGVYLINSTISLTGSIAVATRPGQAIINVNGSPIYSLFYIDVAAICTYSNIFAFSGGSVLSLNSGDLVTITVQVSNYGSKLVSVNAGSIFSGALLC